MVMGRSDICILCIYSALFPCFNCIVLSLTLIPFPLLYRIVLQIRALLSVTPVLASIAIKLSFPCYVFQIYIQHYNLNDYGTSIPFDESQNSHKHRMSQEDVAPL